MNKMGRVGGKQGHAYLMERWRAEVNVKCFRGGVYTVRSHSVLLHLGGFAGSTAHGQVKQEVLAVQRH